MRNLKKFLVKIAKALPLLLIFTLSGCKEKDTISQIEKDGLVSITVSETIERREYYYEYDNWDFSSVNLLLHYDDGETLKMPILSEYVTFTYTPEAPARVDGGMFQVFLREIKYTDYKGVVHDVPDTYYDIWVTEYPYYTVHDIPRLLPLISVFVGTLGLTVVFAIYLKRMKKKQFDRIEKSKIDKKVLFVCTNSNSVVSFRKDLINYLRAKGAKISVIAGDNEREDEIKEFCDEFYCVPFDNRSKNPIKLLTLFIKFRRIIRLINPYISFNFQIKPNIIGSLAERSLSQGNVYCMIEGLGDPYTEGGNKKKVFKHLINILYRKALREALKVFVLNKSDYSEVLANRICKKKQLVLIPGIGINTKDFIPSKNIPKEKKVIMIARLIKSKGIFEYCEIAKNVRETRKDITFDLYGEERELTRRDIKKYTDAGIINYKGFVKDINTPINESRIVCLPSYREGFPKSILEAMALKRAVVASDTIGINEEVINNETGYLVKLKDIDGFANKILEIIDDDKLLTKLGDNARKICEKQYESDIINEVIFKQIFRIK